MAKFIELRNYEWNKSDFLFKRFRSPEESYKNRHISGQNALQGHHKGTLVFGFLLM